MTKKTLAPPDPYKIDMSFMVHPENGKIVIILDGIDDPEDSLAYAEYLSEYLPLLLYDTEVLQ